MSNSQEILGNIALTVFELNGQLLKLADTLAAPAGLTAARWQVLGAILETPLTQAAIARRMGITRQSVRRTASQLATDGMITFEPNPAHRKAELLRPTDKAYKAVKRINPQHKAFAKRLETALGTDNLMTISSMLTELKESLSDLTLTPK